MSTSLTATGAEILEFYLKGWPGKDWYHDDSEIEITDEENRGLLDPQKIYPLSKFGYVYWQGDGALWASLTMHPFSSFFLAWKAFKGKQEELQNALMSCGTLLNMIVEKSSVAASS